MQGLLIVDSKKMVFIIYVIYGLENRHKLYVNWFGIITATHNMFINYLLSKSFNDINVFIAIFTLQVHIPNVFLLSLLSLVDYVVQNLPVSKITKRYMC